MRCSTLWWRRVWRRVWRRERVGSTCRCSLDLEGAGRDERFTPHALRRACATHQYERGMDLIAVQQLLGHRHIASTMAYVKPSRRFVEDAWRRATDSAVHALAG